MPTPIPANRFDVWTFPSYEEWIKGTALGFTQPRSDRLKKIDVALKEYQETKTEGKLAILRSAFRDWTAWKGAKWATSERNTAAKGALFTRLDKALRATRAASHAVDAKALEYQETMRRMAVARMFMGKKVTLKCSKVAERGAKLLNNVRDTYKNIKGLEAHVGGGGGGGSTSQFSDIRQAMEAMITRMFDVQTVTTIMPHLMNAFGGDIIAAVVPILGHCRSGAMLTKAWGDLAVATYTRYSTSNHGYVFGKGDPAAAFDALDALLRSEVNRAGATAAINSADFATRSLLALADGGVITGPITGAATAVARLTKRVYELSIEYKETKAVNRLLLDPNNLGMKLFQVKPLLGCYMICCATDWELMNMAGEEFGQDGWMDDVQAMKKDHITPVRTTAHALIEKSVYEIAGLTSLATRPITAAGVIKSAKRKIVGTKKMEAIGSKP